MADIWGDGEPVRHEGDPHAFTDTHDAWGSAVTGQDATTQHGALVTQGTTPAQETMNAEEGDVPHWAKALAAGLTTLTEVTNKLSETVANLEIDMRSLQTSVSRLSASSMMAVNEIAADYVVNRRSVVGVHGGDCQMAAGAAVEFFSSRSLMRPEARGGVLYSPSGSNIRWGAAVSEPDTGSPDKDGVIGQQMAAYKLKEGSLCVWVPSPDAKHPDAVDTQGHKHFVAYVTTLDCAVAVDWGIRQFDLPDDVVLFL